MPLKILSDLVSAIKTIPVINVSWPLLLYIKITNSYPWGSVWKLKHMVVCKTIITDENSWSFVTANECTVVFSHKNDQCVSFWKNNQVHMDIWITNKAAIC